MAGKNILSGIQPSGDLHIGNYLGALKQWVHVQDNLQPEDRFLFMLADLNTITVDFKPEQLQKNIIDLTAWFLAAGLDPAKVALFRQAENPDHTTLTWIFSCLTPMGWLERMIQYKEKSKKQGERTSAGLLLYPALQASDILLYDVQEVPVGEDQVQHIEFARDIAQRFNTMFGETFVIPKAIITKEVARVMSLQDPTKKMSKSDENQNGVVRLIDDADTIRSKVKRAVTDSGTDVRAAADKPALTNLLGIYSQFANMPIAEIEKQYVGKQYGEFKADLAEVIVKALEPMQKKYAEYMSNQDFIHGVLDQGVTRAHKISSAKINQVMDVTGLSRK